MTTSPLFGIKFNKNFGESLIIECGDGIVLLIYYFRTSL